MIKGGGTRSDEFAEVKSSNGNLVEEKVKAVEQEDAIGSGCSGGWCLCGRGGCGGERTRMHGIARITCAMVLVDMGKDAVITIQSMSLMFRSTKPTGWDDNNLPSSPHSKKSSSPHSKKSSEHANLDEISSSSEILPANILRMLLPPQSVPPGTEAKEMKVKKDPDWSSASDDSDGCCSADSSGGPLCKQEHHVHYPEREKLMMKLNMDMIILKGLTKIPLSTFFFLPLAPAFSPCRPTSTPAFELPAGHPPPSPLSAAPTSELPGCTRLRTPCWSRPPPSSLPTVPAFEFPGRALLRARALPSSVSVAPPPSSLLATPGSELSFLLSTGRAYLLLLPAARARRLPFLLHTLASSSLLPVMQASPTCSPPCTLPSACLSPCSRAPACP
ncbi:hypothetical protein PR202_ga13059 [Eleusine coracana subsp. coracana]|uniref:Uncharacterized protein n=1 Tax=Eleusine coracana subsp. coracana TaxID=191504 RepID=A0AAV5CDU2_ELECO|nr:hypothetical protein PR202_ga13059 [Eleusine coracana subsp. coracana]